MTTLRLENPSPLLLYVLRLADDALVLGHRLSEWCGHGPMLEEDIALTNVALDLVGQARSLYQYAATVEGAGRDEDAYAYLRDAAGFRNVLLVEQPNRDFAHTIVRQLFHAAFMHPLWHALTESADPELAAIAAKSEKEAAYHVRHSAEWAIRLGDGTDESHARMAEAVEILWPFTGEMFEVDDADRALIERGIAVDPATIRPTWEKTIDEVFAEATLTRPEDSWMQTGGRQGRHSEHLGYILADMQFLQRAYPGARW